MTTKTKTETSIDELVDALKQEPGGKDSEDAESSEAPKTAEPTGEGSSTSGVELVESLPIEQSDDLSGVEGEAAPRLVSVIESLLFAGSRPMTVKQMRRVLKDPSTQQIQLAVKALMERRAEEQTGVFVAQVAGGFVLQTKPENAQWVQRMLQARPIRLSRPQLETLAVVAYRQPVTRAELDHIRGVDGGAVLKILLERDLVKIVGKKEEPGRPMLYGTTVKFLEFFNLMTLRDLPDLREFRELSDGTKEMLQTKMGIDEDEAEVLGQEVLDFAANELEKRAPEDGAGDEGDRDDDEGESDADNEPEPEAEPVPVPVPVSPESSMIEKAEDDGEVDS